MAPSGFRKDKIKKFQFDLGASDFITSQELKNAPIEGDTFDVVNVVDKREIIVLESIVSDFNAQTPIKDDLRKRSSVESFEKPI